MYSYQAPQTQACQPGSRYSTLLIRDDVEDEIRKPNNVVCRDHEMQIILGKSYCTDLLARKNSNHLSHTLTTSQKTFTAQQLDFLQMGCKSSTVFDSLLVFLKGFLIRLVFSQSYQHTTQNSWNKWTKISSLEINILQLKNDGKKWSRIYFEIDRAPSEIPANLPSQFSPTGQIFLHWAAATLKGLGQFQNKFQTTFYNHF